MTSRPLSVGPVADAIVATARRRVASSEDPARFAHLVSTYADSAVNGIRQDEPGYSELDGLLVAAHIEAMAGLRRLRARRHRPGCACVACRLPFPQPVREGDR